MVAHRGHPGVIPIGTFCVAGIGLTNYMGCGGVFGTQAGPWAGLRLSQYKGMMLPVTKTEMNLVTLEAVSRSDGASTTLMIGESIAGANYITARDVGFPWITSGSRTTSSCIPNSLKDVTWAEFSSKHSGMTVNFVMETGQCGPCSRRGGMNLPPRVAFFHTTRSRLRNGPTGLLPDTLTGTRRRPTALPMTGHPVLSSFLNLWADRLDSAIRPPFVMPYRSGRFGRKRLDTISLPWRHLYFGFASPPVTESGLRIPTKLCIRSETARRRNRCRITPATLHVTPPSATFPPTMH